MWIIPYVVNKNINNDNIIIMERAVAEKWWIGGYFYSCLIFWFFADDTKVGEMIYFDYVFMYYHVKLITM